MKIIDTHSHLWLKQDTSWNGLPIKSLKNGRSIFLGEEVQMIPPFIIDGQNTAEVFLSNMDYAQVAAAIVVQELIDGCQNDYLLEVARKYPDRFITCGMCDYFNGDLESQAKTLMGEDGKYIGVTAQMDTLTELKSGNVDFVVIDKTMAASIIGNGDYADLAVADAVTIESEQYAIGFKKGSDLTAKVNGAIKELAEDGTLAKLAEKYGLSNYVITNYN